MNGINEQLVHLNDFVAFNHGHISNYIDYWFEIHHVSTFNKNGTSEQLTTTKTGRRGRICHDWVIVFCPVPLGFMEVSGAIFVVDSW